MKRASNVLMAAVVALAALGSLAATSALADQLKSSGAATVSLSGHQKVASTFKTTAGGKECKSGTTSGTGTTPTSTLTLTVTTSECSCFGVACTIDMNGCQYLGHLGVGTTATVDIVCPPGQEITGTSSKCTTHIKPQTGLGSITFKNIGTGSTREIELEFKVEKISYAHTEGSGIGKCTTGSGTTGVLTGTSVVTAVEDGSNVHVGVFVE